MAATRVIIQDSAAQTATAQGSAKSVKLGSMLALVLNITTGSGTPGTFDFWLEGSADGGNTWTKIPADEILANDATVTTATTKTQAGILTGYAAITAKRVFALFRHLPFDTIRAAWAFTGGTSYSLTFDVKGVTK